MPPRSLRRGRSSASPDLSSERVLRRGRTPRSSPRPWRVPSLPRPTPTERSSWHERTCRAPCRSRPGRNTRSIRAASETSTAGDEGASPRAGAVGAATRPELWSQDLERHIAAADVRRSFAAFFPRLGGTSSSTWSSNTRLVHPSFFKGGIVVAQSLLEGGAIAARYRRAQGQQRVEKERALLVGMSVLYDVDLRVLELIRAHDGLIAAEKLVAAQEALLDADVRSAHREGLESGADLARALGDYHAARRAVNTSAPTPRRRGSSSRPPSESTPKPPSESRSRRPRRPRAGRRRRRHEARAASRIPRRARRGHLPSLGDRTGGSPAPCAGQDDGPRPDPHLGPHRADEHGAGRGTRRGTHRDLGNFGCRVSDRRRIAREVRTGALRPRTSSVRGEARLPEGGARSRRGPARRPPRGGPAREDHGPRGRGRGDRREATGPQKAGRAISPSRGDRSDAARAAARGDPGADRERRGRAPGGHVPGRGSQDWGDQERDRDRSCPGRRSGESRRRDRARSEGRNRPGPVRRRRHSGSSAASATT